MKSHPFMIFWRKALTVILVVAFASMAYSMTATASTTDSGSRISASGAEESGAKHSDEAHCDTFECFDPVKEFDISHHFGPEIIIGPFDLSITKAVIYLWLALLICCGFTVYVARRLRPRPDRKQSFVEALYEFTSNGIAGETLPETVKGKPFRSKYFPYIASLFVLIWTVNFISFIPLPLNTEHTMNIFGVEIPSFALYASTSNLNVTLALTIVTLVLAHYEGVKNNGGIGYLKSFAAGDTLGIKLFTWPLHLIGEFAKVISLSVRLFANMLGGHLLILVMLSLAGFIGSLFVMGAGLPLAVAFFLFEVGIVVTVQAFIFAILSGVYIGGAAEPHH